MTTKMVGCHGSSDEGNMKHDEGKEALRKDENMKGDSKHCRLYIYIREVFPTTTVMDSERNHEYQFIY